MTYQCIDEGVYEVELEIYRDCFGGGADFDMPITFGVFSGEEYSFGIETSLTMSEQIVYDTYQDCDPNAEEICVQRGIYTFEIELPVSDKEYKIVYQRCCWAQDILNIVNPVETGITVLTTISAKAQQLCNKQVKLNFPMAFASCPNVPIDISLPVVDAEGDTYEYGICIPYEGGGNLGSSDAPGDPSVCDGIVPTPPCDPPYFSVELADGFTEEEPFPTVDGISIDNETGVFSFTPSSQGRYIYSLCFTEYRDGEVIGRGQSILQLANQIQTVSNSNQELDNSWKVIYLSSTELLKIISIGQESAEINVFDSQGKTIKSLDVRSEETTISTESLSAGNYFIQWVQNGKVSVKKVAVY